MEAQLVLATAAAVALFYFFSGVKKPSPCEGFGHDSMPPETDLPFYLGRSPIHGLGVFPTRPFHPGRFLFEIIDSNRNVTPIGRKVNHCWKPNTKLVQHHDGTWWLVSYNSIRQGEELTVDYRDTPSFIKKPLPEWRCN